MTGVIGQRAGSAARQAPGPRQQVSRIRRILRFLALDPRHAARHLLIGFALGGAAVALNVAIYALAGWYRVQSVQFDPWPFLVGGLGGYFLIAFAEEFLFRGVLFRVAEWALGTIAALVLSALAFGLVHLGNPGMTVFDALAGAAGGGVVFAAAYILTRSLWFAIGAHWAVDFWQGSFFGLHPAGTAVSHPLLHSTLAGPQLWIGDTTGGGLVAFAIFLPIMIGMLILTWRRGCFKPPPNLVRRLLHRPA